MHNDTATLLQTLIDTLKLLKPRDFPILFTDSCSYCGKSVSHLSHLTGSPPPPLMMAAMTTRVSFSEGRPLKTCLSCGHTTLF